MRNGLLNTRQPNRVHSHSLTVCSEPCSSALIAVVLWGLIAAPALVAQDRAAALSPDVAEKLSTLNESDEIKGNDRSEPWQRYAVAEGLADAGEESAAISVLEQLLAEDLSDADLVDDVRYLLVDLYEHQLRFAEAIEQLTLLIDATDNPYERSDLLSERAILYAHIADHVRAAQDRQQAARLFLELERSAIAEYEFLGDLRLALAPPYRHMQNSAVSLLDRLGLAVLLAVGCWLIAVPFNIWMGNRQRREGRGSWGRLLRVSLLMAAIQSTPLQLAILLMLSVPLWVSLSAALYVALTQWLLLLFWSGQYLLPPTRWCGSREELPEVTEPEFLRRLQHVSSRIGVSTPVARQVPSGGGAMLLMAFAGGLPQPSITVTDGILLRLKDDEADAIIAHELAHIANRSLWVFPLVLAVSLSSGVLVAIWFGFLTSLLFGYALQAGLGRLVSRFYEYDSDRRAARATGFASTIRALDKIHQASMVGNRGWASFLAYAMATHPSQEERLTALYRAAPSEEELPDPSWSVAAAERRRYGSRVACCLWLAALVSLFLIPNKPPFPLLRVLLLLGIILLPHILLLRAVRKEYKAEQRRRQVGGAEQVSWKSAFWVILLIVGCSIWAVVLAESSVLDVLDGFGTTGELIRFIIIPAVAGFVTFMLVLGNQRRSPAARLRLAMHQQRWEEARELGEKYAQKLRRNPAVRNDLNLVTWQRGERQAALTAMQELRKDFPKFLHPWLMEALMHLEQGDPQTALQLLEEVRKPLENDIAWHGVVARCQRFLGNLDAVEEAAETIETLVPDSASVSALRSAVAMDRGDAEQALHQLELAEHLAPGDTFLQLLKAEWEFRFGTEAAGIASLTQARRQLQATPFAFLGAELQHVESLAAEQHIAEE